MPLKVWNGSAWTSSTGIKVWNGSSWVTVQNGKVWNGSSWVTFFSGLSVNLQNYNAGTYNIELVHTNALADSAQVRITLLSNGTATYDYEDSLTSTTNFLSYSWLTSGSASDAYAYMDTPSTGSFAVGSNATNTSLQLSTSRQWIVNVSTTGGVFADAQAISTIRIKDSSGNDLAAKTIYMYTSVGL
jgi:hypothetical protein